MAKKNKRFCRRSLALLLTLVMAFSLFQVTALAAPGHGHRNPGNWYPDNDEGNNDRVPSGTVSFKVYLLYSNQIPANIQQSFPYDLFGPSGDNEPYTTVTVDVDALLAKDGVDYYTNDSGHWYISYQTCEGLTAKTLWSAILECMDAQGQAFFADYFENNYIGYVIKVEGDGGHIDGVYEVNPAYLTEIYIDNTLQTTLFDNNAHDFGTDVLGWFESYADITWDEDYLSGTFTSGGRVYSITVEDKSDLENGVIDYTEKTSNFYVAALYYTLEDITLPEPETYDYTVVADYYTNEVKDNDFPIALGGETDVSELPAEAFIVNSFSSNVNYSDNVYTYTSISYENFVYTLRFDRSYEEPPIEPPVVTPALYPVSYEYINYVPANAPTVPATVEYEEGDSVAVAANPTLEGYTFSGWDKTDFIMPAEPVVICGSWFKNETPPGPSVPPVTEKYTVSYEYTGEVPENAPAVPATVEYEEGIEVIVAEDPVLEGYTFSGWDRDNFTMPAEPVVIRGSWTANEQPPVDPPPVEPPPVEPPYIPPYIPPVEPPVEPPVIDIPDEEPPLVELPDEEPPLAELPDEEPPLEELPDEDVPLADVPKTGDIMIAYVLLAIFSGFGLVALSLKGRKLRRSGK